MIAHDPDALGRLYFYCEDRLEQMPPIARWSAEDCDRGNLFLEIITLIVGDTVWASSARCAIAMQVLSIAIASSLKSMRCR